jgi:hypothetical protein
MYDEAKRQTAMCRVLLGKWGSRPIVPCEPRERTQARAIGCENSSRRGARLQNVSGRGDEGRRQSSSVFVHMIICT